MVGVISMGGTKTNNGLGSEFNDCNKCHELFKNIYDYMGMKMITIVNDCHVAWIVISNNIFAIQPIKKCTGIQSYLVRIQKKLSIRICYQPIRFSSSADRYDHFCLNTSDTWQCIISPRLHRLQCSIKHLLIRFELFLQLQNFKFHEWFMPVCEQWKYHSGKRHSEGDPELWIAQVTKMIEGPGHWFKYRKPSLLQWRS